MSLNIKCAGPKYIVCEPADLKMVSPEGIHMPDMQAIDMEGSVPMRGKVVGVPPDCAECIAVGDIIHHTGPALMFMDNMTNRNEYYGIESYKVLYVEAQESAIEE